MKMAVPYLNLHAVNDHFFDEYVEELKKLFEAGQFVLGPAVQKFEEQFTRYIGVKFGVGGEFRHGRPVAVADGDRHRPRR
jgi:hypothetical protein